MSDEQIGFAVVGSGDASGRTPYTPTTRAFTQTGAPVHPIYPSTTALPKNGYDGQKALVDTGATIAAYTYTHTYGWTAD